MLVSEFSRFWAHRPYRFTVLVVLPLQVLFSGYLIKYLACAPLVGGVEAHQQPGRGYTVYPPMSALYDSCGCRPEAHVCVRRYRTAEMGSFLLIVSR